METTHQVFEISPASLPNGDNLTFLESSFFKEHGAHAKLPTPAMVREESTRLKNLPGTWARKSWAVPFFPMKLLVKWGREITIAEGQCLWAIRKTIGEQIPVPEVYGWCRDGGEVFIYQQLIEGQTLENVSDKLSQSDRVDLQRQLRQIVISLRSLRQAPGDSFVGNIARLPLGELIFEDCPRPAGPFSSVKDFNDYYINLLWKDPGPPPVPCRHPKRCGLPDDVPVVFTHADLSTTNIIVSFSPVQRPTIVGIVDWHQSGWYPVYWEACKSISNTDPDSEWGQILPSVFVPYDEFLATFGWMISAGIAI